MAIAAARIITASRTDANPGGISSALPASAADRNCVALANGIKVVDDFGHHPTAIHETLRRSPPTARYGQGKIWALFEPRSNSTRRAVFQDQLASAFEHADGVVMARVAKLEQIPEAERLHPESGRRSHPSFGSANRRSTRTAPRAIVKARDPHPRPARATWSWFSATAGSTASTRNCLINWRCPRLHEPPHAVSTKRPTASTTTATSSPAGAGSPRAAGLKLEPFAQAGDYPVYCLAHARPLGRRPVCLRRHSRRRARRHRRLAPLGGSRAARARAATGEPAFVDLAVP